MFKFLSFKKFTFIFSLLLILSFSFFINASSVSAQNTNSPSTDEQNVKAKKSIYYRPNLFIPGMDKIFTDKVEVEDKKTGLTHIEYKIDGASLAKYIKVVYGYAGIMAGAFAMFMLVYGAWQWLMAAGNSSKIAMAKETVNTTLIGLAFLFGGYLLLSQISTRLVDLKTLQVKEVSIAERCSTFKEQASCERNACAWMPIAAAVVGQPAGGTCIPPTNPSGQKCPVEDTLQRINISDPRFGMHSVSDPSLTPATLAALDNVVRSLSQNEKIILNSAFRSWAKQQELYNCYQEKLRTGGCRCFSCNEAARPSCEAPHQTGKAVDVCYQDNSSNGINTCAGFVHERFNCLNSTTDPCTPELNQAQNRLQQLMSSQGFSPYAGEWWHFEYTRS